MKLGPIKLREMNTEYAIESKLSSSPTAIIKGLGGLYLEYCYHLFQLPLAARSLREYVREIRKPEIRKQMRENVFNSLRRKGYSPDKITAELDRIIDVA